MSASSGKAPAILAPCSVRNQPLARPDCGSTSSWARPSTRSRRRRERIFSIPASGAASRRSCSAVAMRNWNSAAMTTQVISTSRVSPSGSAPVRALALVLVLGWALSLVVIAGVPSGWARSRCSVRSP